MTPEREKEILSALKENQPCSASALVDILYPEHKPWERNMRIGIVYDSLKKLNAQNKAHTVGKFGRERLWEASD